VNGGNCHVNWQLVAWPIQLRGLGVRDMERTGLALQLRWMWFVRTDDRRAWSGMGLQFTKEERSLFFASTMMTVGNGTTAKFWEDRWIQGLSISEIAPVLYACIPKRRRKSLTVADGLQANRWARDIQGVLGIHEIGQYLQVWQLLASVTLTDEPDKLVWRWTASGVYTTQSAYLATFQGATSCRAWKLIWRLWAPLRVKFFNWLANLDR
jgi:hypothetical protein